MAPRDSVEAATLEDHTAVHRQGRANVPARATVMSRVPPPDSCLASPGHDGPGAEHYGPDLTADCWTSPDLHFFAKLSVLLAVDLISDAHEARRGAPVT